MKKANLTETHWGRRVVATITGPHAEAENLLESYLKCYPAAGYMTSVETRESEKSPDGETRITIGRLASCD